MKATTPLYTPADRDRLRRFISLHEARLSREAEALALLSARVEGGRGVEPENMPSDRVTMHSQVRMQDADSGRLYIQTVALPSEREPDGSHSLLRSYPALALLGARVGDDVVWRSAGRLHRARIAELLFQPEASARRARSGVAPELKSSRELPRAVGERLAIRERLPPALPPGRAREPIGSKEMQT